MPVVSPLRAGKVISFDEVRGMGSIVDGHDREYPFHCVSIADGTRQIEVNQAVEFMVGFAVARTEAVAITKTTAAR